MLRQKICCSSTFPYLIRFAPNRVPTCLPVHQDCRWHLLSISWAIHLSMGKQTLPVHSTRCNDDGRLRELCSEGAILYGHIIGCGWLGPTWHLSACSWIN